MTSQMLLLGLGGALLVYFLYRIFKGSVSRTVAIPPALAAAVVLFAYQVHPGVCALAGVLTYLAVSKVIEFSIRWAATAAVLGAVGLVAYGAYTGRLVLP